MLERARRFDDPTYLPFLDPDRRRARRLALTLRARALRDDADRRRRLADSPSYRAIAR
jgi:hypothetical protein